MTSMFKGKKVSKSAAAQKVIQANYSVIQFSQGMIDKYDEILTDEEKESFRSLETHMINLNTVLSKQK